MTMLDSFTDWRDEWDLVLRGDVSRETREVYLRAVRQFTAWLADTTVPPNGPAEVTERHVRAWMAHLIEDRGLAAATRRVRLLAVRFWLDYLAGQADSGVSTNPAARVPLPVPLDKPVPVIPDEDLRALLDTCAGGEFVDVRDLAILRLLLDTGARRGEVVGIDVDDLDLRQQEVTVTGKGSRTRVLPFGSRTAIALRKYLRARDRRPHASACALFLSVRPHADGSARLTGEGLGQMVTRRAEVAGLGRTWPHMFRHTWAHDMLDNGAAEGAVEKLGGWTPGSKMVKRYGSSMAEARARKTARTLSRGDRV